MKSKLSTTFALLGVLAAGTAAAAVNTQALQSRAESTIGATTTSLITPAGTTGIDPATQVIQLDASVSPAAQAQAPVATAPATQTAASPTAATIPVTVPQAQQTAATATIAATPTQSKPTFNNEDDDDEEGDDDDD
jgi:hypothetical protein